MLVLNAFSLNMIASALDEIRVSFTVVTPEFAAAKLRRTGVESAVGHADTAGLFSSLLGIEVPCERRSVILSGGEQFLVGQYRGPRLPEGTTVLPEGAEVVWYLGYMPTVR
jgi:hypothetical protein